MNPEGASAAYGYAGMGPYAGGQAGFVLVPRADFHCLKLPGAPLDEWEHDFLLLADVSPTAFHATDTPAFLESPANRVPFPAIEKEVLIRYLS
jgi:glutathione-independent formaldehyde dehydrogenase